MLKQLLQESRSYLNSFFEQVDIDRFEEILSLCQQAKGLLLFTGVGKSGIIAEKIAMTLVSTGTKALYLPPTNLLHGDIGILSEGDLVLLLSKSGESEELLNLLPFIRRKKAQTIALISKPASSLAKACDHSFILPVQKELCSFDLIPTTSAQVQLIFGDILAIALMKKCEFSLDDYAHNHPSGAIGKKITLTVKDLMKSGESLPLCQAKDQLSDVLVQLSQKKCGALLITNEEHSLEGIFTDGDLRRSLQAHGPDVLHKTMGALMTQSTLSVPSHILAWDAMKEMQKDPNKWVMVTPVIEDGKVIGILRMHDIIKAGLS